MLHILLAHLQVQTLSLESKLSNEIQETISKNKNCKHTETGNDGTMKVRFQLIAKTGPTGFHKMFAGENKAVTELSGGDLSPECSKDFKPLRLSAAVSESQIEIPGSGKRGHVSVESSMSAPVPHSPILSSFCSTPMQFIELELSELFGRDIANLSLRTFKKISQHLYNELLCGQPGWNPKQSLAISMDYLKTTLHSQMLSSACFDYLLVYTCRIFGADIIYDGAAKTMDNLQTQKIDPKIVLKAAHWKIHRLDFLDSFREKHGLTKRTEKKLVKDGIVSPRHNHFIPNCHSLHYNSAILAKGALNFEMMDSLGPGFDENVKTFLKAAFQVHADDKKDLQFIVGKVPKQSNSVDCGYCTMYFCWHKLFGLAFPPQHTMMNDIVKIRTWSLLRIYKDGIDRGDYPPGLIERALAHSS